ncbi:MAG: alpha/beta fold hydrolase [Candidatus Delongbacteria bacterium]|nr:alpha/beta fold hydrolase [Candidatus Delongbacteria bacterium]
MTIILSILKILVTTYIIFALLLFFLQRKMLYLPQEGLQDVDADEIEFENGDIVLRGWVVNAGKDKAMLYYGGNAETIETNIAFYRENFPNYTLYLINYRGFGKSDGNPTEENLFNDALFIYDQISSKHKKISLIGRSLGTGIAVYVASKRKVDKLVLITPFDSILNVAKQTYKIFPFTIFLKDKYESINYVKDVNSKILFLIAEKDRMIKYSLSMNLYEAFGKNMVELTIIKDAGHNTISHYPEFSESMKNFLKD